MATEFHGIFPAIITPMTPEGKLNEAAFRKVIEFNIQAGVHGFWVAGGSGESVLLDDEENSRIAEIVADQSNGRIKNIMHVGAPTTARAAKLAEHAAKAGVESIAYRPSSMGATMRRSSNIIESWALRLTYLCSSIICRVPPALKSPLP